IRRALILISFLLMLLAIAGWLRSRKFPDTIDRTYASGENERSWGFAHRNGLLFLHYFHREHTAIVTPDSVAWLGDDCIGRVLVIQSLIGREKPGLRIEHWQSSSLGTKTAMIMIGLPYWLLTLLFAIAPVWWTLAWKHRRGARRRAAGCCVRCGYDLRAS